MYRVRILSISRYSQSKAKENVCDFSYEFIEKYTLKVEKNRTIMMTEQNTANFKHEYYKG